MIEWRDLTFTYDGADRPALRDVNLRVEESELVLVAGARDDLPADLPVTADALHPELRLLTRGAEQASADEVAANPRAQSVRVRAAERLRESSAA